MAGHAHSSSDDPFSPPKPCTDPGCGCNVGPPLFQAVHKAPGAIVDAMLRAGADPNQLNQEGRPVLQFAAAFKRYDAVVALLAHGADARFVQKHEKITAAHMAARSGDSRILKLLFKAGAKYDAKDSTGFQPLHTAILYGRSEDTVKLLLKKGSDIEAETVQGLNPLALATMVRSSRLVHILLSAGADVMARGHTDMTALHLAAAHGVPVVSHLLLAAGADAQARDVDGDTPSRILGTGEGMDGSKPSRSDAGATGRVLLRAPAYRSRAWLWTATQGAEMSSVGGGGDVRPRAAGAATTRLIWSRQGSNGKDWCPVAAMLRYASRL